MKYQHHTAAAGRWRWAFRLVRHLTGSSTHSLDPHWTDAERCSLSFGSLLLFYSSLDPDFLAFASHAHLVQQLSQTQEVRMTSILFIGDQTWSWSRAWWHVQDLQQLRSLLYWYCFTILLACIWPHNCILKYVDVLWFQPGCCRVVFKVLHFWTCVAISRGLLLETLIFLSLRVMQTVYNIWVRHTSLYDTLEVIVD
jgi:hypothetical protein